MYVYEGHLGHLYVSDKEIELRFLKCHQCGDYDWLIGNFETPQEFLIYCANDIDCNDGNGGYRIEHIYEDILCYFDEDISKEEAIKIVQANRTLDYEESEE